MSRRLLFIILALVVISSLVIIGCGPKPAPTTPAPAQTTAAPTTTTAAPKPSVTTTAAPATTTTTAAPATTPAQPATVIKWIAQDDNPNTNPTWQSLDRLSKAVNEASGGRLVIQANPGGAIVPADTELDPTSNGVLQAASNGPILWKALLAQAPLFSTYIGGPTAMEYFMWYRVGDGFKLMQEMFAQKSLKVTPLASWATPPEVFLYTSFPITDLNSVKGKKMRLLGDEAVIFGKLGISAVSTPSPELYQAMKSGTIDGFQHSDLGADAQMGFQEVAKYAYMSPVRQPTDTYIFYVNNDAFAKLPADLKKLLTDLAWAEGLNHFSIRTAAAANVAATWQKAGVNIQPVPEFFKDAVVKSANEFYADMKAKDAFYAKAYDNLVNWHNTISAAFPTL